MMMVPHFLAYCFLAFARPKSFITTTTTTLKESREKTVDCVVGLDVGTQGTKCLAYSHGKVVARASVSYDLEPTQGVQGRAEQNPAIWWQAVETCLSEVGRQLKQGTSSYSIAGIGVSGQQHGMVALDNTGEPVRNAKLWCDVEAAEEAHRIQAMARKIGIDRTFLTPGFTAPKILWMKEHEPDKFAKTKWFVLPHDYIVMKLGSLEVPVTDAGDASGNGIFDVKTRQNIPALADLIDPSLKDKMPRILGPSEIVGYLNDHCRTILNTEDDSPIPISVGSGDNMCSALGVGCVLPGQAIMSLGTSGTLFGVIESPVPTDTPLAPFCDATGQYLPLACTMSCTGVLTQVLDECCPEGWTHEEACQRLDADDSGIGIGCDGVTFLPYLGGERTPNWPHATGALIGLTAKHMNKDRLGLLWYRACMEAITFCLADTLQYFPENAKALDKLYLVGGGAKNAVWRQMIADVMQCQLVFPVETESAALGAAFQAGAAAEGRSVKDYVCEQNIEMESTVVQPIPANIDAYQKAFQRYRKLGRALFGTM